MTHAIGHLSFISGLPISFAFERGLLPDTSNQNRFGRPGELDDLMAAGELAAAPISSLEYIRRRERYALLPNLSLSSWGRIGSACLFTRGTFAELSGQTIALPTFGATSNALVQWLLQKLFGVDAQYVEVDGRLDELLAKYPAALLIGDEALVEVAKGGDLVKLDLGEAWWQMMHTPFVHTVWACQANLPADVQQHLATQFGEAKALGRTHHTEIVAEATRRLGLTPEQIEAYYALLNYELTPVHRQSISLFDDYLHEKTLHG